MYPFVVVSSFTSVLFVFYVRFLHVSSQGLTGRQPYAVVVTPPGQYILPIKVNQEALFLNWKLFEF